LGVIVKSELSAKFKAFAAIFALLLPPGAQSLAATKAPEDASAVLTHVHVGAYYHKWPGGLGAPPSWMAEHADFVQGEPKSMAAFKQAGGRYAIFYTDPNKVIVARHEPYWDLSDSAFLHDSQGNRISRPFLRANGVQDDQYILNPASPETQAAFARETQNAKATGVYDFVFLDDVSADLKGHLFRTKSSPVELKTDQDLVAGHKQLIARSALPVIANGLNNADQRLGQASLNIQLLPVLTGALAEGCFASSGALALEPMWTTTAESLLATTTEGKWAFCMVGGPRGEETQARLYGYASWLLTYDDTHSVIWENMYAPGPSRVEIYPEQALVPTNPVDTPKHIWDLKRQGGAYAREFQRCYYQGKLLGVCAAVVNPSRNTVSTPTGYKEQVVLIGGNSLEGGTLEIQSSITTSLPSGSAAILVR
jgi:hypothetical protein